jgi:hypothetical protein
LKLQRGSLRLMMGACEFIQQQLSDVKRRQELGMISATSPQIKEAFKSLAAADEAFLVAWSGNEIDRSGTGREAFSLEEEGRFTRSISDQPSRLCRWRRSAGFIV